MSDATETKSDKPKSKAGLIGLLVIVGVLLIAALFLLPWILRGSNQGGVVTAVKAAGGLATYGFRLSEDATYGMNEKKGGQRGFVEDMMGEAYTEPLTQIIWKKTSFDSGLIGRIAKLPALEIIDLPVPRKKVDRFKPRTSVTTISKVCVAARQSRNSGRTVARSAMMAPRR